MLLLLLILLATIVFELAVARWGYDSRDLYPLDRDRLDGFDY